jgi:hypothetical protein
MTFALAAILCTVYYDRSPEDYRPITLMNAGYKRMTRIIANRLRPLMADLLQPSQHSDVLGNTVFEAVAAVRELMMTSQGHHRVARFQGGLRQHFPYMPFCHVKELWVQRALHIPHPENV